MKYESFDRSLFTIDDASPPSPEYNALNSHIPFKDTDKWSDSTEDGSCTRYIQFFTNRESCPMVAQVDVYDSGNERTNCYGYIVDNQDGNSGASMLVAYGIEDPNDVFTLIEKSIETVSIHDLIPPSDWIDSSY
jgi:hypothetical protein